MTFTASELAKEAEREMRYRVFVYPRLVTENRLTPSLAQRRIAMMETIASDYRLKAEQDEAEERLL